LRWEDSFAGVTSKAIVPPKHSCPLQKHQLTPIVAAITSKFFQEYILPDVKDRQHLITLHKSAKKLGLDLNQYNDIKREIAEIEHDLRRLNDPLYKNLPAFPPKTPNFSQTEIDSSKKLKAFLKDAVSLKDGKNSLEKISNILESATKRLKK
jgi:hypothetical protein